MRLFYIKLLIVIPRATFHGNNSRNIIKETTAEELKWYNRLYRFNTAEARNGETQKPKRTQDRNQIR